MFDILKTKVGLPVAKTNIITFSDSTSSLVDKLLNQGVSGECITYRRIELHKGDNGKESSEAYFYRLDSTIKKEIRTYLNLDAKQHVNYVKTGRKGLYVYFFISNKRENNTGLIADAKQYGVEVGQVAASVLYLRLALSFIQEVSGLFSLSPVLYNSDMYISAYPETTAKQVIINALKPNIYVSTSNEIVLSLNKVKFGCTHETEMNSIASDTTECVFEVKNKQYNRIYRLDARKMNKRKYMDFKIHKGSDESEVYNSAYIKSVNYSVNDCLSRLAGILTQSGVDHVPLEFQADYYTNHFLEANEQARHELIVIDNYSACIEADKRAGFIEHVQKRFNPIKILSSVGGMRLSDYDASKNYLVINYETETGQGTITKQVAGDETTVSTFIQALLEKEDADHKQQGKVSFDFYTAMKIENFYRDEKYITQGLNMGAPVELKPKVDENGQVKTPEDPFDKLFDKNIIKKIESELWLKDSILRNDRLVGTNMPDCDLLCFYARRNSDNKVFLSVVDLTVSEGCLRINNHKIYRENESHRVILKYPQLRYMIKEGESCSNLNQIHDKSFFVYDKQTKLTLNSYHSSRVPSIVGNALVDSLAQSKVIGGIHRKRDAQKCLLPYYINPAIDKQMGHVFLKDNKEQGLLYFISRNGQPPANYPSQILMQNILVFDEMGTRLGPMECSVTEIFLKSFTLDILRNNETAKKSLLQKVAELYLEN